MKLTGAGGVDIEDAEDTEDSEDESLSDYLIGTATSDLGVW